jgi:hypothetical protein
MDALAGSAWGVAVLWAIGAGLLAYALWRGIDAAEDLECYGTDGKGIVARIGLIVSGVIHAALGAVAIGAALSGGSGGSTGGGGGQGRGIEQAVAWVLGLPGGRWLLAAAAVATIGAGIYYVAKGARASYRKHLAANPFTTRWDKVLRAGVIAQGVVVGVIGGFLGAAALNGDPDEAGGLGQVFDWLATQPFGNILVIALCVGLAAFAFFCAVNAAYRIVPRVTNGEVASLAARVKARVA